MAAESIPPADGQEFHLRFLLINGGEFRMDFPCDSLVRDVKQAILDARPRELVEVQEKQAQPFPSRVEELRIVHLGRFLGDSKSLDECGFECGGDNVFAVHVTVRTASNRLDEVKDRISSRAPCHCGSCVVS
mmetsp:Transcript_10350/g.20873  ORF Transcript_10350/g.20873 Transcript_10350/m.20873 type:complete len:132 (-) Transcript_10350:1413-1808(-)|eukprot:CAMPEP_0184678088 /NCGR_PEP_ID=MMETSP0312-20130426/739_1 /TAXON_ID=31354 /ORGANISM="Compsopogon coeruleus, Strain SAG 36.94" /LENGTH=131 /DNA_ID=CAMNT_0027126497 /DNA_START=275 /DNA_END=670 /DNA_ORIENTATION=+